MRSALRRHAIENIARKPSASTCLGMRPTTVTGSGGASPLAKMNDSHFARLERRNRRGQDQFLTESSYLCLRHLKKGDCYLDGSALGNPAF